MKSEKIKNFAILNIGVLLLTAGVYFFKFPNHFSTGGVAGLAVILQKFLPFSPSNITLVLNLALMVLGFFILGKGFGVMSAYATIMFSVEIGLFEHFFPMSGPFTDEPLLELVFAVMLPALGSAMVFNIGASTGGTDIVAMILKKFKHMDIGRALLVSDIFITVAACVVYDMKTGLFSIMGLMAKSLMVDSVIESINLCKYFTIITAKPQEIGEFITKDLNRGATSLDASGVFTHNNKTILICAVSRPQAVALRTYVRSVDPQAFMLITNTSEIIGKGFHSNE